MALALRLTAVFFLAGIEAVVFVFGLRPIKDSF
jgi:hypothetical protein